MARRSACLARPVSSGPVMAPGRVVRPVPPLGPFRVVGLSRVLGPVVGLDVISSRGSRAGPAQPSRGPSAGPGALRAETSLSFDCGLFDYFSFDID